MTNWIGKSLIFVGVIHSILGLYRYRGIIRDLAEDRFFNSIAGNPERLAAFWFLIAGFSFMIIGGLIAWAGTNELTLPPFLKRSLLLLSIFGCFMAPISGFWLILVCAGGLFLFRNSV